MVHAARHLENHCNEAGRASTQHRLIERNNERTKHEDEVAIKTEQFQEEAVSTESKQKRGGVTPQKIPSKLSYQDRFFSSMANYFIYSSAYPPFNTFRDESYLQMMSTVAGASNLNL